MKHNYGFRWRFISAALVFFGVSACVQIPQESADLSMELGKQISAIESSHLALVDKYFAEKRGRIDQFLVEEWVPEFAAQFFSNNQISRVWDQVVRSNDPQDRLQFLVTFGPKLQSRINQKRLELVRPLEEAERLVKQELNTSYDQARSINNSITSFLVSTSEVADNRQRYLEMIGVKEEKIANLLDEVDSAVGKLTEGAEKVADNEDKIKQYYQKLKELKNKIKD